MKLVWVWLGEGEAQGHPGDILKGTLVEKLGCIYKTASWGRDGMPHRIRWGLEKNMFLEVLNGHYLRAPVHCCEMNSTKQWGSFPVLPMSSCCMFALDLA